MADEKYTFEQAKIRLEEIASLARKKDTSLEKSLDLLEEGVRLANICTELVDHTDMSATATVEVPDVPAAVESAVVEDGAPSVAEDAPAEVPEDIATESDVSE